MKAANGADIKWGPMTAEGEVLIHRAAVKDISRRSAIFGIDPVDSDAPIRTRYQLRSADEVASSRPINWLVKGVLPESGIAAIYGASGSAKSFLALDLAMAVSLGAPWFDHRAEKRPVVYVGLEGEAGLANRLSAYRKQHGRIGKVFILTEPFNLSTTADIADLAEAIRESAANCGMIIVDTLNRAAPGLDENSSSEMGRAIAAVKSLQSQVGGLVLLIHHSGKQPAMGMRGHSSLFAALDAVIEVTRTGDAREWRLAKSKDGADGIVQPFSLRVVDLGADDDGDLVSSCVVEVTAQPLKRSAKRLTPAQQRGMDAFMAAAAERGMVDGAFEADAECWRAAYYRISTADSPDAKRKAFSRVRSELVEVGNLIVSNDVYRIHTGSVNFPEIDPDNRTNTGHVPDISRTGQDTIL